MDRVDESKITRSMLEILGRNLVFSYGYKEIKEKGIRRILRALRLVKPRYQVKDKVEPSKKLVIKRYSRLVLPLE